MKVTEDRDSWEARHERFGLRFLMVLALVLVFSVGWFGRGWMDTRAVPPVPAPLCQAAISTDGQGGESVQVGPGAIVAFQVICSAEVEFVQLLAGNEKAVIQPLPLEFDGKAWVWMYQVPPEIVEPVVVRFYPYADGKPAGRTLTMQVNPRGKGEGK